MKLFRGNEKPGVTGRAPPSTMMLSSGSGHDINMLAAGARLPTMHTAREYVEAGGLISHGSNYPDPFRRAGDYVDKILRGAKPAGLPVEQPTKFDLVVNLTTAKAVGLTFPETFRLRADRPGDNVTTLGLEVPAKLLALADDVIE